MGKDRGVCFLNDLIFSFFSDREDFEFELWKNLHKTAV